MVYSYPTPNEELIAQLSLLPHPEGGYFAETMRAEETVPSPFAHGESRPIQTSIYYLLTAESPDNYFHMNKSTTMHVLHQGRSEYTLIYPPSEKTGGKTIIKRKIMGDRPGELRQLYVEGGVWKTSRLLPEDLELVRSVKVPPSHIGCLITEVVTPGFAWQDHTWLDAATLQDLLCTVDVPMPAEAREEIETHIRPSGA